MVGRFLKDRRLFLQKTQEELALRLEVHKQNISNWELGKADVPTKYYGTIAEFLEVSATDLIFIYKEGKMEKLERKVQSIYSKLFP